MLAQLLKARPCVPLPDLSPFLQRRQVKEHANDVFEDYSQLLLETVLRLPYQMKMSLGKAQHVHVVFDNRLQHLLAEVNTFCSAL